MTIRSIIIETVNDTVSIIFASNDIVFKIVQYNNLVFLFTISNMNNLSKPMYKPLKGGGIQSATDTIDLELLAFEQINNGSIFQGTSIINVVIEDSSIINTPIGTSQPNIGIFSELTDYGNMTLTGGNGSVFWDSIDGIFNITNADLVVTECSFFGNIKICDNTISANNANGDVTVMANGFGNLILEGPITNTASFGNMSVDMNNGNVGIVCKDGISFSSRQNGSTIGTFSDQYYTTVNGDLVFTNDTGIGTRIVTNVKSTIGNTILVTTSTSHNLAIGDVVTLSSINSSPSVNGTVGVSQIIGLNQFGFSSTVEIVSQASTGTLLKSANNDILLNSSRYVKIPSLVPLTFGSTSGWVVGTSTGALVLSSVGDIALSGGSISVPLGTKMMFGSSSFIQSSSTSTSLIVNSGEVGITGTLLNVSSTNVTIRDPNIIIGSNYVSGPSDTTDRGIQYGDISSRFGWFGYKRSVGAFTFIPEASVSGEIVSGSIGNFLCTTLTAANLVLSGTTGVVNLNCGNVTGVGTLFGCNGTLNLSGSSNVSISAGTRILLGASQDVLVPMSTLLRFSTGGNYLFGDSSRLNIVASQTLVTTSGGSFVFGTGSVVGFNSGTSTSVSSDTSGNLSVVGPGNVNLNAPNVILNANASLFLSTHNSVSGNSSGLLVSAPNVRIVATSGSILLDSTSRISDLNRLVFKTSGTNGSITVDSSQSMILSGFGSTGGALVFDDWKSINVLDNSRLLFIGSNGSAGGSIHCTGSSFFIQSDNLSVSSTSGISFVSGTIGSTATLFTVIGTETRLYSNDTRISDPNVTLGDTTSTTNNYTDRGVEYRYLPAAVSTSSNTLLGWFGYKNSSGRFTFYSEATNGSNVISGVLGDIESRNLYANTVVFSTRSNLSLNCGTLGNTNTITSCSNGSGDLTVLAQNFVLGSERLKMNSNSFIEFGTIGNTITCDTTGTFYFSGAKTVVQGDLQVNGTTTNVYSTVTNIKDPIVTLGMTESEPIVDDLKDRGIEFKWYDTAPRTGFFGYKNSTGRFTFIQHGTNTGEIFSGDAGTVQFGNIYGSNLYFEGSGNIYNVSSLNVTSGNIVLNPGSGGHVTISGSLSSLYFGGASNEIRASSGNLIVSSSGKIVLDTPIVDLDENVLQVCPDSSVYCNSAGHLILDSLNSIVLETDNVYFNSSGHLFLGGDGYLSSVKSDVVGIFGSTNLYGDMNVTGVLSATDWDFDLERFIIDLGKKSRHIVTSISNSSTVGIVQVSLSTPHYLVAGDTVEFKNTNSDPSIDGIRLVDSVLDGNTLAIVHSTVLSGTFGNMTSKLVQDPGKDVGVQINFWSTAGSIMTSSGTVNYHSGFFGFKRATERWSFYRDANIVDNVVTTGTFGSLEADTLYISNVSGFTLLGGMTAGSQVVSGNNFIISGGLIDFTPIGSITASSGRFTTLTNTVSATLTGLRATNTSHTPERIVTNIGSPTANPNVENTMALVTVTGTSFTGTGTMPVTGLNDGQMKIFVASFIDTDCTYELTFPAGKLVTPNPMLASDPTKITFKRSGQSVQLVWDNTASYWITMNSGAYIS